MGLDLMDLPEYKNNNIIELINLDSYKPYMEDIRAVSLAEKES